MVILMIIFMLILLIVGIIVSLAITGLFLAGAYLAVTLVWRVVHYFFS